MANLVRQLNINHHKNKTTIGILVRSMTWLEDAVAWAGVAWRGVVWNGLGWCVMVCDGV